MKKVTLLGSTGSIGTQTLEIIDINTKSFEIVGLSCNSNIDLFIKQVKKCKPKAVSIEKDSEKLKALFPNLTIYSNAKELVENTEGDILVAAISGMAMLEPLFASLDNYKRIALANKESLVCRGTEFMKLAKEKNVEIIPVDSEHYAIFSCLKGIDRKNIKKIILTASGGALYDIPKEALVDVEIEDVLAHPNWQMGKKITVDSATMANKALEVIEAHHLFGLNFENIEVVIHRQSIIHSMVELVDGSIIAQLAVPNMKIPISGALYYPEIVSCGVNSIDWANQKLTFEKLEKGVFPIFDLIVEAGEKGDKFAEKVNYANELAVSKFLNGEIRFVDIEKEIRCHL